MNLSPFQTQQKVIAVFCDVTVVPGSAEIILAGLELYSLYNFSMTPYKSSDN